MSGESYIGQLRGAQLGLITGFAARLAGLQILRDVRRLSKCQNWRADRDQDRLLAPKDVSGD